MHGVGGVFNEAICNRDKERHNGSGELKDVNADFAIVPAFTQIKGQWG
jgi:hypothetical protein